jgi:MFS family permease
LQTARLISRDYRKVLAAQAASSIGDQLTLTTLMLWTATILFHGSSAAPEAVAALLVVAGATTMIAGPIAGVYVDRWDRRKVMLCADASRAVAVAGLVAVSAAAGHSHAGRTLVIACLLIACVEVGNRFFFPSRMAYIADIVPDPVNRARAASYGQTVEAFALIVGPPLAAPLLFAFGPEWGFAADGLSYVLSYLLIRSIKRARIETKHGEAEVASSFWRDLSAGYRLILGDRMLTTVIITIIVVALGTGSSGALEVFFISANLHVRSVNYGWLAMVFGSGMIAGALAGVRVGSRIGYTRMMSSGLLAVGVCMAWYAKLGSFGAGLLMTLLTGIFVGLLTSSLGPILLEQVPNEFLGRVNSAIGPAQQLASVAAVLCAGWLVSGPLAGHHFHVMSVSFGPLDTVMMAGGLLIMGSGIYAVFSLEAHDR